MNEIQTNLASQTDFTLAGWAQAGSLILVLTFRQDRTGTKSSGAGLGSTFTHFFHSLD